MNRRNTVKLMYSTQKNKLLLRLKLVYLSPLHRKYFLKLEILTTIGLVNEDYQTLLLLRKGNKMSLEKQRALILIFNRKEKIKYTRGDSKLRGME